MEVRWQVARAELRVQLAPQGGEQAERAHALLAHPLGLLLRQQHAQDGRVLRDRPAGELAA
jgi:hypothetical protein